MPSGSTSCLTLLSLDFERHHAGVPSLDPTRHELLIHGLVDRPLIFTMDELKRLCSLLEDDMYAVVADVLRLNDLIGDGEVMATRRSRGSDAEPGWVLSGRPAWRGKAARPGGTSPGGARR